MMISILIEVILKARFIAQPNFFLEKQCHIVSFVVSC